jgi:hypothetical protein
MDRMEIKVGITTPDKYRRKFERSLGKAGHITDRRPRE